MNLKPLKIVLLFLVFSGLSFAGSIFSQELEMPQFPFEPSILGRVENTDTYFEITDSQYLNIKMTSSAEVKVSMESIPRMISLDIEAVSAETASTTLTLEGLEPNKTYYQYQDSYQNIAVLISDENGAINWEQDLTQSHHVWLQGTKSTIFITQDTVLTDDLMESVEISTDNVTLDCDNHQITGSDAGYGIFLNGFLKRDVGGLKNVRVKNCRVSNFSYDIYAEFATQSTLENNTAQNGYVGIQLQSSPGNFLIDNISRENQYGIYISYSGDNTLYGNQIQSNQRALTITSYSGNNILRNNIILNNQNSLYLCVDSCFPAAELVQDIDTTNTINGKPIYYLVNQANKEIPGDAGFVGLVNSSNITVKNLNLDAPNYYAIFLASTTSSRIESNNISNSNIGIYLSSSVNNTFLQNTIKDNRGEALYLRNSSSNLFYHNNFINNVGTCPQVFNWPVATANSFDNGYPQGGNYWSDYAGVDLKSGAGQDEDGADGIGDTPQFVKYYSDGACLRGQRDRYPWMAENGWAAQPPAEKWSFAIITDLHIGRGYDDYDGATYDDTGNGENYYLTERLEKVVNWIKDNKNNIDCEGIKCPMQFLAVLGDITNTAEKSQFLKAKEILDRLNDPNGDGNTQDGIPYVPVFGNHDVWPYTDIGEVASSLGEIYFDDIFWNENATNIQLLKQRLNFQRDEVHKWCKNFAFNYKDMNFIGLDFNSRDPLPKPLQGVGSDAVLNLVNEGWLEIQLDKLKEGPVIVFSHHPFIENFINAFESSEIDEIKKIIENKNVLANFGGHIHGYYSSQEPWIPPKNPYFTDANATHTTPLDIPVVTTESMIVASNELNAKGVIRIVEMEDDRIDNYDLMKGEDILALNPYFKQIEWSPKFEGIEWGLPPKIKLDWKVEFELYAFNKLYPLSYTLNFGDGSTPETKEVPDRLYPPEEIVHIYPKEGGTYNIELTAAKTTPLIEESITRTITIPRIKGGFFTLSPVDIVLTDPDGLIINKEISEISGAFYFEIDLDDDGELNDIIILSERKIGDYSVKVMPESNATPTDGYTLGAFTENDDVVFLAQDVQISDIPEQPYTAYSGEEEIIPWNYTFTDTFGRNTTLKINTEQKYFQFIVPTFGTGVILASEMKVIKLDNSMFKYQTRSKTWTINPYNSNVPLEVKGLVSLYFFKELPKEIILIYYRDANITFTAIALDSKSDFCAALLYRKATKKAYLLIDKPGVE